MQRLEKTCILSQKMITARDKSYGKGERHYGKDSTKDKEKDEKPRHKKQKENEDDNKYPYEYRLPNHDHEWFDFPINPRSKKCKGTHCEETWKK